MEDARRIVGRNIANMRAARGMEQEPFADLIGMTQSYLSRVENGRVNLTIVRLADVASALGVRLVDLVDETPVEPGT